jgi:hypothetical protein
VVTLPAVSQLPPPNQPPPSGGPYYGQPVVVYNQGTNGLAIFSGLAGILSWFLCPFVGALAAVITGHIALGDLKRSPRPGRGWALTGIILGYLHLALYSLLIGLIFLGVFGTTFYMLHTMPTPSP